MSVIYVIETAKQGWMSCYHRLTRSHACQCQEMCILNGRIFIRSLRWDQPFHTGRQSPKFSEHKDWKWLSGHFQRTLKAVRACLDPFQFGKWTGLFRSLPVWKMDTVALSFVLGKNCLIMDYLGLKDLSRQLRANCTISYSFYIHLMLHTCTARFDVTKNLRKF